MARHEDRFNPLGGSGLEDGEEILYEPEHELSTTDIVLFTVRCLVAALFLVTYVVFFILVGRGQRLKNWRLYALVGIIFFGWLAMSLYQVRIHSARPVPLYNPVFKLYETFNYPVWMHIGTDIIFLPGANGNVCIDHTTNHQHIRRQQSTNSDPKPIFY